jgi:hypothetical protein
MEVTQYSSLNVDYFGQGWALGIRIPPNVNDLHRTMTMGGKEERGKNVEEKKYATAALSTRLPLLLFSCLKFCSYLGYWLEGRR